MIAWSTDDDGTVVYTGTAHWDGRTLTLVRTPAASIEVIDEWIPRIEPVAEEVQEILLGAKFAFSVLIGPKPDDANPEEDRRTGLKWPARDAE